MSDARLLTLSSVLPFFGAFGHAACIVMWAPRLGTGIDVTYCYHFVNTFASNSKQFHGKHKLINKYVYAGTAHPWTSAAQPSAKGCGIP